jgi:predicted short-subunit dehydrogenase-like oxidoreductase (DUF2520 family)
MDPAFFLLITARLFNLARMKPNAIFFCTFILSKLAFMKVSIIGSGNVATVMGRLIKQKNHEVVQVMSRSNQHASVLGNELGCNYCDFSGLADVSADIFLIAVSDYAIMDCLPQLQLRDKMVLHTAGSVSKDVLKVKSAHYGVLYPLQSLRKEMIELPEIPFLVDANTAEATQFVLSFAKDLSPKVEIACDEERLKLHVAAVIVSNFTNHLYAIAESYCIEEKVDFDMLKPLIEETAVRIKNSSPATVQTGPAVRKDIHTLDKHLRLLVNHPKLRTTYLRLTDSIMNP